MKYEIGQALPGFTIASVSPAAMRDWAGFLRDPNPLHLDPEAVRAKGLGDRVINQGPANLAYIINMLQAALPGARIESLDVRYVDNLFGGESAEAGGQLSAVDGDAATCDVWLRAAGRPIITGTAVLRT